MIVNWMLFQNLDCKLAADALGDYAVQGAEIAGPTVTIHGQLGSSVGKKMGAGAVVHCGSSCRCGSCAGD